MLQLLFIIADDNGDRGPPWVLLIFVLMGIIATISQAVAKSRQRREQQQRQPQPGSKPAAEHPPTVNEFLDRIRRMAQGEKPDAGRPTQGPQQPASRPMPPPPPRPVRPMQDRQPAPPPPPRPVVPTVVRPPAAPRAVDKPPASTSRMATRGVSLESVSAFKSAAAQTPPPKAMPRRARKDAPAKPAPERPKAPGAVPARAAAAVSPAELRAALRRRLAMGPTALREAILLGEVLGQPISMRRLQMRRPGSTGRLI